MTVTVYSDCRIFDGYHAELIEGLQVVVENDRIVDLPSSSAKLANATHVDCGGRVLMPGLIDAHFHCCLPSFDLYSVDRMPPTLLGAHAARLLRSSLHRGFTTVRDAGGADVGLWLALEQGVIEGPRLFFSGKALSQTGGHGDMRPGTLTEPCTCGYSGAISIAVDGVDEVRRAAREELRKGAHQLKIFISGGVVSPSDPIWMPQFTDAEITAAVDEANSRRKYVMAHCHTIDGAKRCVRLGVRSIEHATEMDDETARQIADAGLFVVPTLVVIDVMRTHAQKLQWASASAQKVEGAFERAVNSLATCARNGVQIGFGTDLLGTEFHAQQSREFSLRGELSSPHEVLRSATSINAAVLGQEGKLGCIAPGAYADLLVVEGNPLKSIDKLAQPERNIRVIVKGGRTIRNTLSN